MMFPSYRVRTVVIMLLSYANVKNDWSRTKPNPLEENRSRAPKHSNNKFYKRNAKV